MCQIYNLQSLIPKPLSKGEETFYLQCRAYGFTPQREYVFCDGRKWRWDFCWVDQKLAVEIDGGTIFGRSRHSRGKGYEADCEKFNTGVSLGWRIYKFTTAMVERGDAIRLLLSVIWEDEL